MTQKEIQEYNKRCAQFLGAEINEPLNRIHIKKMKDDEMLFHNHCVSLDMYEWNGTCNDYWIDFEMLHFDSDWNWIMEVVEAIENLNRSHSLHYNEIKIFRNHTDVLYNMTRTKRYTFSDDYLEQSISDKRNHFKTKKEAVVQAINQFLIWYEQNK